MGAPGSLGDGSGSVSNAMSESGCDCQGKTGDGGSSLPVPPSMSSISGVLSFIELDITGKECLSRMHLIKLVLVDRFVQCL